MNLHVIIGEDDYLVETTARRALVECAGLEVVDSRNSTNAALQLEDLRRVRDSLSTPPFLEPTKTTWWRNVGFLPGGSKQVAEDVRNALDGFADWLASAPLPENQCFVLSAPRLLKTAKFAKRLSAAAEMVFLSAGKPWEEARQAVVRAIDFAQELGLKFGSGVAEKFVARVGTDARSLLSELGKLRDYLGKETNVITSATVDEITSSGVQDEPELWAFTDALGARDAEKALAEARQFEGSGFAVLITTVAERFFRQLLAVRRHSTDDMSPYAVKKMSGFLRNWAPEELQAARARFWGLREKVVLGAPSVDVLVTTEIVRICRRRRS